MTVQDSSRAKTIVIACRDPLFAGALASAAEGYSLHVTAVVESLDRLPATFDGRVDGLVVVDPEAFPPDQIMASGLDVPVLVLGPADDSSSMISSVESGALGYADVGASFEDLIAAIRSVVEGIPVIPPLMLGSLLKYVVERQRGQRKARERLDVLSARERQVFELTARGYDKQGVADELFISPATARTHVQNTFQKLNVHSVAELVALAAECGLDLSSNNQRSPE